MDNTTNSTTSLSIRLTSDGFSLYIKDAANNIILSEADKVENTEYAVESFKAFLDRALELNINSKQTEFYIESELYTLAPSELFNLKELLQVIELQHNGLPETDYTLQINEFREQKIAIAFIIDTDVYDTISSKFDNCIIKHHLSNVITDALTLGNNIQCIVRKNKFDLISVIDNKLVYCNSITYMTNEDILYHLLNVKDTLKIDFEKTVIVVTTEKEDQSLRYILSTHSTKVEFKTTKK